MPHALLLSPDDQAVSAITGVLEEMSVSCERPLDGPSAAKKLNSQTFDLVLVDCDNLPAAKLIFDVCRRSHAGTCIPIAIVDGRAGLPTAFRLGAELILTKPVAKDQARISIRTAVSRLHKEDPARPAKPPETQTGETIAATSAEPLARAAAAAAGSSLQSTTFEASTPVAAPATAVASAAIEPNATTSVKKTADVAIGPATKLLASAATPIASTLCAATAPKLDKATSSAEKPPATTPLSTLSAFRPAPRKSSDDSVYAELEEAQADLESPFFDSYAQPKKKGHGLLIAALVLVLIGGGFYFAWTYQPQFRSMVQAGLEQANARIGIGQPQKASPRPPAPSQPPAKEAAPQATRATAQTPSASATETGAASASSTSDGAPPPAASNESTGAGSAAVTAPPAAVPAPETAPPATTELPGEKDAVILSSKGAEKRLVHQVQPTYPQQARSQQIEGTVVLRALVGESGAIEGVRLVEGNPVLAADAIKAVKQWRYKPYIRNGRAEPFTTIVLVDFQQP
ncbi:MAG: TonB family protein [Terriglobales bacterium]